MKMSALQNKRVFTWPLHLNVEVEFVRIVENTLFWERNGWFVRSHFVNNSDLSNCLFFCCLK